MGLILHTTNVASWRTFEGSLRELCLNGTPTCSSQSGTVLHETYIASQEESGCVHIHANPNISEIGTKVRENRAISEFPIHYYIETNFSKNRDTWYNHTLFLLFASVKIGRVPIK